MNQLQRPTSGAMQLWNALPVWGRVVTAIVLMIAFYYSFAILFGLFVIVALGVGVVTILRWLFRG